MTSANGISPQSHARYSTRRTGTPGTTIRCASVQLRRFRAAADYASQADEHQAVADVDGLRRRVGDHTAQIQPPRAQALHLRAQDEELHRQAAAEVVSVGGSGYGISEQRVADERAKPPGRADTALALEFTAQADAGVGLTMPDALCAAAAHRLGLPLLTADLLPVEQNTAKEDQQLERRNPKPDQEPDNDHDAAADPLPAEESTTTTVEETEQGRDRKPAAEQP
ncbi:hypothetical protein ACFVVU_36245 [Kitasatospora sp. NPDC057965]|uniref:hypothetical protein n=1 Tax=Kitasatospora sp. NPDC057965 TaxID=3346291 RepID=UPI0036DC6298